MTTDDRIVTVSLTHEQVQRIITGLEEQLAAARAEAGRLGGELFDTEARYSASEDLRRNAEADLAALRQSHAEAVEAAFKEAYGEGPGPSADAAWLASEAKARLT